MTSEDPPPQPARTLFGSVLLGSSFFAPPLRADGLAEDSPDREPRVLHHPLVRAVLMAALLLAGTVAGAVVIWVVGLLVAVVDGELLVASAGGIPRVIGPLSGWERYGAAVGFVIGYLVFVHAVENRRPIELAWRRLPGLVIGIVLGAVLFGVAFGILLAVGAFQLAGPSGSVSPLWTVLTLGVGPALAWEILARAGVHRLVEQGLGTWGATAVSAAAYGVARARDSWASPGSMTAIALGLGLTLGLLYSLTRSLWVVIGFHAAWNLTEGMIFGAGVSGSLGPADGWLSSIGVGPRLLTGGMSGPEVSPVSVVALLAFSAVLVTALIRRDLVVAPAWARRGAGATMAP